MNREMKKNLMKLAGITDEQEFDKMVSQIAPSALEASEKAMKSHSPFQVHFVQMMALIENKGIEHFNALNDNAKAQIQYTYEVIQSDPVYKDVRKLTDKNEAKESELDLSEKSRMIRMRGNKSYEAKDFHTAIQEYSASILCAPLDEAGTGKEASLGLANRSAVFFEMKRFKDCVHDVKAAFRFGYPDDLHFKLHERAGKCLNELGQFSSARESFSSTLRTLPNARLKDTRKESLKKEIEQILEAIKDKPDVISEKNDSPDGSRPCPFQVWETNPMFPPLADCLDIVFNDKVGRHVITKRNIQAGEAIVIEDPIAAHLSPYKMAKNCSHCFRVNGETVVPSPILIKAKFCSLQCLDKALATYHETEGKVDITDIFYGEDVESQLSGCISLAYRAITQKSLEFFIENKKKLFTDYDIKFGTNEEKGFEYTNEQHYRGLFNLVTHLNRASNTDRLTLMIRTVVLLQCLKEAGYFEGKSHSKKQEKLTGDELYIGELLFHFQSGIQYNLHTVYQVEGKMEAAKKMPLVDIGAGVYPTTLFFNHSCVPNTVRINQGPRVVFVAKRNIAAGEEVTDCYGIHHVSMSKAERLETLSRGYAFDCSCLACKNNFPVFAELPSKLPPQVVSKLGTMLSKYKTQFDEGKLRRALKICQDYLTKLEDLGVKFPHRNYEIATMALCSCLWGIIKDC